MQEGFRDIARSRLLTAMEAALNICYHMTAKRLRRIPDDYARCFLFLGEAGLILFDVAERLSRMARFRNPPVHLYWDIDHGQVYGLITNDLDELEGFSREIALLL